MSNSTDQTTHTTIRNLDLPDNYFCPGWCKAEHDDPRHQYLDHHDHRCVIDELGEHRIELDQHGRDRGTQRVFVYLAGSDSTPFPVSVAPKELRRLAEFYRSTADRLEAKDLDTLAMDLDSEVMGS